MQVASRQTMWGDGGRGTTVDLEMTVETGLSVTFHFAGFAGAESSVEWGDGEVSRFSSQERVTLTHAYRAFGKYRMHCYNVSRVSLRWMDGQAHRPYDAAVLSVVDRGGGIDAIDSGGFSRCVNLKRFVAPGCKSCGQRPFSFCTALKEVRIGECSIIYDGAFEGCSSLETYTTISTGCCWRDVWAGCTHLKELRLGKVTQLSADDFADTTRLRDVWIGNKTVDQIRQVAPTGNVVSGYGAAFPWGARAECRFHGLDGTVLGNGTVIRQ